MCLSVCLSLCLSVCYSVCLSVYVQRKCDQYWPESGSKTFDNLTVELISMEQFADFKIRTLRLNKVSSSLFIETDACVFISRLLLPLSS